MSTDNKGIYREVRKLFKVAKSTFDDLSEKDMMDDFDDSVVLEGYIDDIRSEKENLNELKIKLKGIEFTIDFKDKKLEKDYGDMLEETKFMEKTYERIIERFEHYDETGSFC